jgi:hypothetical protein
MAKLTIELDTKFQTNGYEVTEDFTTIAIDGEAVKKKFNPVSLQDISIFLLAEDPGEEFGGISFELPILGHPKGEVLIEDKKDNSGLIVTMKGKFQLKLRAGVKESIKSDWNLRMAGVAYRGGSYSGFMSYIEGQTKGQEKAWRKIDKYSIA